MSLCSCSLPEGSLDFSYEVSMLLPPCRMFDFVILSENFELVNMYILVTGGNFFEVFILMFMR